MEKSPRGRQSEKPPKFYVTTPIYYINDVPHVGHSYTTVVADVLARWHRMRGDDVFFLTGLDENSVKTVQAAHEKGFKDIQKYADAMAENWRKVWRVLNISNDGFIRTTEDRHKKAVEALFMKIYEKGDIYKGKYEGMYCDGCEAFLTESDLVDGKCPLHNKAPKRLKEENYFFKLSKYQDKILQHIENNSDFIQPKSRQAEIVGFIKGGLKDISISRPNVEWGIRVPIDQKHMIWVWFDALTNYISGAGEKRWPADLHIIGKDLVRFHCIIWPGMLLSAGYELPKRFLIHGFLTVGGQKISKSLGNVIDPVYLTEKYSADAVRYFLIRDVPFGEDGDFSEDALKTRLNDELADIVGNLVHRSLLFIYNNFDGKVPRHGTLDEHDMEMLRSIEGTPPAVGKLMEESNASGGLREIIKLAKSGNKYFNDAQPWRTVKDDPQKCATTLYVCAQLARSLAIMLAPYLPSTSQKLWGYLNLSGDVHKQRWDSAEEPGIEESHQINKPAPLFAKIQQKSTKTGTSDCKGSSGKGSNVVPLEDFARLDIRVGEIRAAEQIANSEKLLKLSIEVDGKLHTAVAGISEHYKPGELIGKKVAVVMNLPPVRLMGVESECMILAAEDESGISLLTTDKPVKLGAKVK